MRLLTIPQFAAEAQLHPDTVYSLCRRGQLPATKLGGSWRIDADQLSDLFVSSSPEPKGTPRSNNRGGWA